MVLSNRGRAARRAQYRLAHCVRTTMARDDRAYGCVHECEDAAGLRGVRLAKELMAVAGAALEANLMALGPLVLPLSEQLRFAGNLFARKVLGARQRPYVPDFKLAFEHFCIHPGGRAVIDAVEQQLDLTTKLVAPSRAALHR